MIIKDLIGNKHKINLGAMSTNTRLTRSSLHIKARELLKEIYPTIQVIEEVSIPISPGRTVYFDFFIPLLNTFIEVQGQQHYEKSTLFHKNDAGFMRQKKNDGDKEKWAEMNGFDLICLPYDGVEEWADLLKN
jgi:acetyl-CoA carboxylase alpha subunit